MKALVLLCIVAVARANFFDSVGQALDGVVHTVGDGVKDAAQTVAGGVVDAAHVVGDGVVDAAHAVGGALHDIGGTLGDTFGDVWNVTQYPVKEAGKELLVKAAEFAVQQGVEMALEALAAGKRDLPDLSQAKAFVVGELADEYNKWLKQTENSVLSSRMEMANSVLKFGLDLPQEMKDYMEGYGDAAARGRTKGFVLKQAEKVLKNALDKKENKMKIIDKQWSGDPDDTARYELAHLDLHCLQTLPLKRPEGTTTPENGCRYPQDCSGLNGQKCVFNG